MIDCIIINDSIILWTNIKKCYILVTIFKLNKEFVAI